MLIHLGSEDLRVPNSQGMSLYHTLKARNVETKLVSWYCVTFALISCMHDYVSIHHQLSHTIWQVIFGCANFCGKSEKAFRIIFCGTHFEDADDSSDCCLRTVAVHAKNF